MGRWKKLLLVACGITIIVGSGCATKEYVARTIESGSIQTFVQDPSGSSLPVKKGENITIYIKDTIDISSIRVWTIEMDVMNSDSARIRGKIDTVCCVDDNEKNILRGEIVEVSLKDIERILVWNKNAGDGAIDGIVCLMTAFLVCPVSGL